ncbi:RICIN domain-containing protein [Streptacidiphilus neutrinimicus]|uniref:RICIN domain-containing protein n=1 Tax=Streptacidiphilus neutrinimicus TaxID=105420 RepID=UPI000A071202|nr:RICIN domain-containing protein [Streptacidiphilus neutrinimicus]
MTARLTGRSRRAIAAALAGVTALCVPLLGGVPAADAASAGGPVTTGGGSWCLDDANSGTGNGNAVALWSCDGGANQAFTWNGDGSVTVLGKCLDITGGSDANGAATELYDCNGSAAQKFAAQPDGTLYSAKSGKCLAVTSGTPAAGAVVGLEPCNPSSTSQVWQASTAPAAPYTLSAAASVAGGNGDDTPSFPYLDRNGQFYYQSAHSLYGATDGRAWNFYAGTNFDTASTASISNSGTNKDTTAFCDNSPTGVNATPAPAGSSYAERNYCDLVGVWVDPDTGTWYGLVHNEFTPQPFGDGTHYDAVDYASSTDHGATWTIQGHAVTSPYSTKRGDTAAFPNSTYYYGDGDPRLFVDYRSGYFYVFYMSRLVDKTGGWGGFQEHVARAPISKKMSSASWSKWYDGSWSQPGVGGAESDVIPSDGAGSGWVPPAEGYSPSTSGSIGSQIAAGTTPVSSQLSVLNIAWDAYLGEYIGTPENETGVDQPQHFYVTDDLATEKWTDIGSAGPAQSSWYRWMLDPGNLTSGAIVGRSFRSYCEYSCSPDSLEYTQFTIAPTGSSALPAPVSSGVDYRIGAGDGAYLTQSGAGVTTAGSATGASAQWTFTATGDGFYTVANASSGQLLGVDSTTNAGRAWDAPVGLGAASGSPKTGQEWSVQTLVQSPATSGSSTPTGGYRLVNRYSGLALSLTGGSAAVATAPQRGWDNTGTAGDTRPAAAQNLTLTAAGGSATDTVSVAPPGDQNSPSGAAVTPLQLSASDSAAGQSFTWTATGLPAGLALNASTGVISGTPTTAGVSTVQVTATDSTGASGSAAFTWTVAGNLNGSHVLSISGEALDDPNWSTTQGTQLDTWSVNGGKNQSWTLARQADGAYTIVNGYSGQCMDDDGGATAAGTAVIQWTCTGGGNQEWTVAQLPSGAYTVTNVHSGLLLTTASTADGALVAQQPNTGSALQQWTLG